MKTRTLIQTLWSLIFTSILLSGCQSKSVADNPAPVSVNAEKQFPELEKVSIEKLPELGTTDVLKIVEDYNARNFGNPGWRRVSMELMTDGVVTRSFTVVNLWRSDGGVVRTLFLLEEPKGLSGTNYLLEEERSGLPDMRVYLFLPAGERRVLEVAPSNFPEGLLGSDFSYSDLRTQLPIKGYHFTLKGQTSLLNKPAWVIEAEPTTAQTREIFPWSAANLYLARDFPFLLGVDFYDKVASGAGASSLVKQMRVQGLEQINGVWTATRITMWGRDKRASVLTLMDAGFNSAEITPDLFSPKELANLSEKVRQGWTLEIAPATKQ